MRWALLLGRIAGIEVRIHLTFFLLLAWLAVEDYQAGGLREALYWTVFTCLVFFCVLLHEFGHAFAARYYGIRTPDITLFPFGGVARIERMPEKPSEEIVIALAGPLVNVVIAVVLWLVLAAFPPTDRSGTMSLASSLPQQLLGVNLMLLLFNLIPAFPMDGGRVLRAALAMKFGHNRATQMAARVGQALAIGLGYVGAFGIRTLGMPANPMLIVVAVFVFSLARREARMARLQDERLRSAADG